MEPVMNWPASWLVVNGQNGAGDGLAVLVVVGTAWTELVMDWPTSGVVGDGPDGAVDGLADPGCGRGWPRRSR
jgi:hypothetical protein